MANLGISLRPPKPAGRWPPYDSCHGQVSSAETPGKARKLAATKPDGAGDEGTEAWLNPELVECTRIGDAREGPERRVMRDYHAA